MAARPNSHVSGVHFGNCRQDLPPSTSLASNIGTYQPVRLFHERLTRGAEASDVPRIEESALQPQRGGSELAAETWALGRTGAAEIAFA